MRITPTSLPEVLLLEPQVFGDERGYFLESFRQDAFDAAVGHPVQFVQDNHSHSRRGVLRGLHYQLAPHAQGKLVRVTHGSVFDVAVDMRRGRSTFGHWTATELSAENHRQMWIPPGFAHGFLVLSEQADFLYKTTDYYAPASEAAVRWNDPSLAIPWPLAGGAAAVSARDAVAPFLADARPFD
jgi:dTDP-4-dehydrorhamnose 3,5-epimerase